MRSSAIELGIRGSLPNTKIKSIQNPQPVLAQLGSRRDRSEQRLYTTAPNPKVVFLRHTRKLQKLVFPLLFCPSGLILLQHSSASHKSLFTPLVVCLGMGNDQLGVWCKEEFRHHLHLNGESPGRRKTLSSTGQSSFHFDARDFFDRFYCSRATMTSDLGTWLCVCVCNREREGL